MIWTQQLAPTGALRVCINLGNALLAQLDPTNQEPQGISVELAQALAKQLDAELQIQLVNTAKESVAAEPKTSHSPKLICISTRVMSCAK